MAKLFLAALVLMIVAVTNHCSITKLLDSTAIGPLSHGTKKGSLNLQPQALRLPKEEPVEVNEDGRRGGKGLDVVQIVPLHKEQVIQRILEALHKALKLSMNHGRQERHDTVLSMDALARLIVESRPRYG